MDASRRPSIVFMGTPEFALPSLHALINCKNYDILAAITQPDRPAKRGHKLTPPPVKELALEHGIPVFQSPSLKKIETVDASHLTSSGKQSKPLAEFLSEHTPIDAFISVAYGNIIPVSILDFARYGVVNIHPSLLPRWRGAAPIQYAIHAGDTETGVAIMRAEEGLDTGPVFATKRVAIEPGENYGALHDRLAEIGATYLLELLPAILDGSLEAKPQGEDGAIYAHKWEKSDCIVQWNEPATAIVQRVLASSPRPGGKTSIAGSMIKVLDAHVVDDATLPAASAGSVVEVNASELIVASGDEKFVSLDELQFPGKKNLPIREILKGHSFKVGDTFE